MPAPTASLNPWARRALVLATTTAALGAKATQLHQLIDDIYKAKQT